MAILKSTRIQFKFWLYADNPNKPDDQTLMAWIRKLKDENAFTKAVRDGLMLLKDLRAGNTDVLEQLFPDVVKKLRGGAVSTGGNLSADQLALIADQVASKVNLQVEAKGGKLLNPSSGGRAASRPLDDLGEDLIEILSPDEVKKDLDNVPQFNMVIQMSIMTHGHCNGVSPEARAYGVRTKRIKMEHLTPAKWQRAQEFNRALEAEKHAEAVLVEDETQPNSESIPIGTGGPKAMNVPQFAPPDDGDDDLDDLLDLLE